MDSADSRQGPMKDFYEYGNEPSGSIKAGQFVTNFRNCLKQYPRYES
jgi:hypothetical protein